MVDSALFFLQIGIIVATAKLVGAAFRFIRQPAVLGEITAGVLLGPSLLGRVAPSVLQALFPASSLGPLYALSQLGLVLFMFMVGLEVQPRLIRKSARAAVLASEASIVVPFACGAVLALALHPRLGGGSARLPFVLFVGAAMAVTAFPVLARILADRNLMNTRVGMLAISCAAVDDVTAWCLLAVITVVARRDGGYMVVPLGFAGLAAYVAVMLVAVRPALRFALPANESPGRGRFAGILILLMASAWATEMLQVHALFGAFMAGVVMPRGAELVSGLRGHMESLAVVLLLPLFFAYNGLRTSVGLLNTPELWLVCGVIVLVAIGSKLLVSAVVVRASGIGWRESLAVGALVNTRGLVELVILNVGLELGILTPTLFSMMVIMALATTFMTSPLLDWIDPELARPQVVV